MRDGVAYSVMTGIGESYLSAYALFLRATNAQIAVLAALPALLGSAAQLLSGWLSQRLARRRTLILIGAGIQTLAWLPIIWLPFLFPALAVELLIASVALYYAGGNLASPPWSSLMGDLVPERRRGRFFARRTRLMSIANFLALLAAGALLHALEAGARERLAFTLLFALAALARAYSAAQLAAMHEPPHEPRPFALPRPSELAGRLRHSDFVRFTMFFACFNFTVAIASPFFTVYMLRDLGFSYFEFTLSTAASVLAQFLSLRLWGRVTDAWGNGLVLRATGTLIPLFPVLWLAAPGLWYVIILQLVGGACWAGFSLAANNYLYDTVPREQRAGLMAVHQVLSSVAIFAGALVGGFLGTVAPEALGIGAWTLSWTSGLWAALLVSTLGRSLVAALFLPTLRETRIGARAMTVVRLFARLTHPARIGAALTAPFMRRRTRA